MKIGDVVRITDGSWSMVSDNDGVLKDVSGKVLIASGDFKIEAVGCFDKETENNDCGEVNDVKLRCVKDHDRIVYTQMRFCYVV